MLEINQYICHVADFGPILNPTNLTKTKYIMMTKTVYEEPLTRVIEVMVQRTILEGSITTGQRKSYGEAIEENWE